MYLKKDKYNLKMIREFYNNAMVDLEKNIIKSKVSRTIVKITSETFVDTFNVCSKGVTDMREYYNDTKNMMKAPHIHPSKHNLCPSTDTC